MNFNIIASYEISEQALLRDLIFVFQGLDGKYIKYESKIEAFTISSQYNIPQPVRNLVRKIAEVGWMYKKVSAYVTKHVDSPKVGLFEQVYILFI